MYRASGSGVVIALSKYLLLHPCHTKCQRCGLPQLITPCARRSVVNQSLS
jgi:hypothetical protein